MNTEFIKLYKFIEGNEEIMSYLEKLLKTIDYKDQIKHQSNLDKLQELGDKYLEATKKITEAKNKLEKSGLVLTDDSKIYLEGYNAKYEEDSNKAYKKYGHYSFYHNEEYSIYHDYEWLNENRVSFPTTINGFEVTKKILFDEEENHTSKKEYEKWLQENPNLINELNQLEKEINEDLELLEKKIFGKKALKEKIERNKEKLIELNNKKNHGEYLKKKSIFFESLDDENKALINDYLDSIDNCNDLSKNIRDIMFQLNKSCESELFANIDQMIEEAIAFGFVTQEEVEKYEYILINMDLSNVLIDDDTIKVFKNHVYAATRDKIFIDKYCKRIFKMRMQKDFNNVSKEAEAKTKVKK